MGLDFFRDHECQIDVVRNVLTMHGNSCDLTCSGAVGCYRISLSEKVNIPAMTEMIIEGQVEDGQISPKELCIVEPKDQSFENSEMLVARSLVYCSAKTPIRVMNITDEDQILYPGTNIATMSHVCSVKTVKKILSPNNEQVPEHLNDLFDRTVVGMGHVQRKEIAKLLNKYSEVFSKSDDDIGRSGIIKHRIPTGNDQPIKDRRRKVPVHINKEVDAQIDNMLEEHVIKPSKSPWASSIVMVKKTNQADSVWITES